jgi:phenylpyruvate tautomerase PptA (4-oxalocrotonate tautomerase family)
MDRDRLRSSQNQLPGKGLNKRKNGGSKMPFIHIRAYSGRDSETKKKAAQAIVKAASEAMGAPETAFTVVYEDYDRDVWENEVAQPIIEPLRDKMLIDHGKLL